MKPIRVLHIRSCRGITHLTGAETYLLSLLQGLDPQECESLLICITDPGLGETPWLQELKQRDLPFVTIPVRHRFSLRDFVTVPSWIRQFQADIIHSHDHRADVAGIAGAKAAGKPVLATCQGWTNWPADSLRGRLYPWLDRQVLRHVDAGIVVSASMADDVYRGASGPPVVVIPNGVDTKKFDPTHVEDSLRSHFFADEGEQAVVIGIVARIHPNKGQLEFLKVAAELSQSHKNCRFLIVGNAPPGYEDYQREMTRFIADQGLERIVVVTQAPIDQIPAVMASIDILVAPSYTEGLSFSLLEAMAMEKPTVATQVGGNSQFIPNGEAALLVSRGDWHALGRMVETLIDNPERRKQLGRQARQHVKANLSIEAMVSRTMRVYKEVMAWKHEKARAPQGARQLRERLNSISGS